MGTNVRQNIVTNGLVLYLDAGNRMSYPGSGTTWSDLSGNGNTGTLTNGPTFNSLNQGSIVFDGVNDTAVINDATSLNFGTGDFSVGCFIYVASSSLSANTEYALINKNTNFENSPGWGIEITTYSAIAPYNTIYAIFYNTGQTTWGNATVSSLSLPTNNWNYIVGTRVSTTGSLYINGVLVAQKINNQMSGSVTNSSNIILGDHSWGPNFKGNIAITQIYNRALSPQEILQNYNATKTRFGLT